MYVASRPQPSEYAACKNTSEAVKVFCKLNNINTNDTNIPADRDIKVLLKKHSEEIANLKSKCEGIPFPESGDDGIYLKYDDIFFLRYVLSFKKDVAAAVKAIKLTVEYREEEETQKMVKAIYTRSIEDINLPTKITAKHQLAFPFMEATNWGGFCVCIRVPKDASWHKAQIRKKVSRDELLKVNYIYRESSFMWNDQMTRLTGRLVKQILLFDLSQASLSSMGDKRESEMFAEVSKRSGNFYPQMMDKLCFVNAPSWMSFVLSLVKPILPKKVTSKFELFSSADSLWASPWASVHLKRANVPAFYGGALPQDKLPFRLKEEALTPKSDDDTDDDLEKLKIGARHREFTSIALPVRCNVDYSFLIENHNINVEVKIVQDGKLQDRVTGGSSSAGHDGVETSTSNDETLAEEKLKDKEKTKKKKSANQLRHLQHWRQANKSVMKKTRIESKEGLRKGVFENVGPGILIIEFDNSYSFFTSKEISYHLALQEANIGKGNILETAAVNATNADSLAEVEVDDQDEAKMKRINVDTSFEVAEGDSLISI